MRDARGYRSMLSELNSLSENSEDNLLHNYRDDLEKLEGVTIPDQVDRYINEGDDKNSKLKIEFERFKNTVNNYLNN